MNSENSKPLIIVISGTYGVGKTTLAHILGHKLNIQQRVGLGVISKTLRYIDHSNPIISKWGDFSDCNNEEDVIEKLHLESELIGNILKSIIDKAFRTGEPYIIDGVQLLPQYLPLEKLCYFTLVVRNEEEHRDRFMNPDVTKKKHLNNANFDIVKIVGNEILKNAKKYNTPIFESDMSEKDLADLIINKLNITPVDNIKIFEKIRNNTVFSDEELNLIRKTKNPCLVIIKPHVADKSGVKEKLLDLLNRFTLSVILSKQYIFNRNNIIALYKELCDTMNEIPEGKAFIEKLVNSYTGENGGIIMIVSGDESYKKVKVIKKLIRENSSLDRHKNVLHSSDNYDDTMRELLVLT